MDVSDVRLASAPDPAFDWRRSGTTAGLKIEMRLGGGSTGTWAALSAIRDGTFPGRQIGSGVSIACVTKAQARRLMEQQYWAVTAEFEALDDDEPYYLVITDAS